MAGCGASSESGADVYDATSIKACLRAADAAVADGSDEYIAGDASGGAFHVQVAGDYATVAIAVSEAGAIETARLAQRELESLGRPGELAHHRANVAYWQLDETDAPVRAVADCLDRTATTDAPPAAEDL
jgi:hypothetical protein